MSNHSSQRVLDMLEALRILARDADQGGIGIVETAANKRTCNAFGRICGKCWTDVTEGPNMEKHDLDRAGYSQRLEQWIQLH